MRLHGASPFPSTISVAGVSGGVTDVNVTLNGFGHADPQKVGVVIVGPGGQSMLLMNAVGSGLDVTGLNIAFDDSAAQPIDNFSPLISGSFRPADTVRSKMTIRPGPGRPTTSPSPTPRISPCRPPPWGPPSTGRLPTASGAST